MKENILITLILFIISYIYLRDTSSFIKKNDSLMQEIKDKQVLYNQDSIDAIITSNTMIPGVNGKRVNLDKSYQKMKSINKFNEGLLVFDEIPPIKSINNHFDKVILGNPYKEMVSVILEGNSLLLKNIDKYIKDNNLEVNPDYCLTDTIKIDKDCLNNHQYTILIYPIKNYFLSNTKKILKKGIIISFYLTNTNYQELFTTIKYIKNNYEIVSIQDLIKETIHQ